jgi:hypothetical protein
MSAYSDLRLAEQYELVAGMLIDSATLWTSPDFPNMNAPDTAAALNASARALREQAKQLRVEPRTFGRITSREQEDRARSEALSWMLTFRDVCADRRPGLRETLRAAADAHVYPERCVREARISVFGPDPAEEE